MKTLSELVRDVEFAREKLDEALSALRSAADGVAGWAGITQETRQREPRSNMKRKGKIQKPLELSEKLVRDLHGKGMNDVDIAGAVRASGGPRVTPRQVQRMRSKLGLPGRGGRPKKHGDADPLPPMDASGMPKRPRKPRGPKPTPAAQETAPEQVENSGAQGQPGTGVKQESARLIRE